MLRSVVRLLPLVSLWLLNPRAYADDALPRFIEVAASTSVQRTALANLGVSLEVIGDQSVWVVARPDQVARIMAQGLRVLGARPLPLFAAELDFPSRDARFHNYARLAETLRAIADQHPDLAAVSVLGQSVEGRDILALHLSTDPNVLAGGATDTPGALFVGNHHAREHLSLEVPLLLAQYLVDHRDTPEIAALLGSRDIWIVPTVNPDGAEYDIASGHYRMWRKNRRDNDDGSHGVDLNRNYGYEWSTTGASDWPRDETYHGKAAFSEPESRAVRDFVLAHDNLRVLLSFHTYSELILYPWGFTSDPIDNARDKQVFETMARTMAKWNGYTPEQSSELYAASGDTTDWAYGERGIFAFTFELSPRSMFGGGFYPGQRIIDRVFDDNLKPCLYLIDAADDPYKVLEGRGSRPRASR